MQAFLVLLLPSVVIPLWYDTIKKIEHDAKLSSQKLHTELLSEIKSTAELVHPMNASAMNLARVLNASVSGMKLPFSEIKNRVAPMLFQALSITPHVSQISYIGIDGLLFSYYAHGSEIFALYSNSSISVNSSSPNATAYTWYIQRADSDTGKLYGKVITSPPLVVVNASWFEEAMNSTNGYSSLGTEWNSVQDLFLNTAKVDGRGAVSLGFPVKEVTDFLSVIDLHDGSLCLATEDNKVLIEGLPNTQIMVSNDSISFKVVENQDGDQISHVGNVSCKADDRTPKASVLNISNKDYVVYCSQLEIMGVKSVYALAFPYRGLESRVHKSSRSALILHIVMVVIMVILVSMFMFLLVGAARREMYLRAKLIKQMDATQQAERKSMNKSLAFASASHDVRASLAGLTGLIDISKDEVAPGSEIETNLIQMEGCTKDLLGILNSILDTSKIEAGKMQLEEEEFNLEELLEDVVDLYHPVGMKKGVDVVLDPHDGSVAKFSRVKGDRMKLKQVLCNLLSNAVKFTSEGHVSIRAWAKKPIQKNPNCMEFVFEVDDTGKGVPKEKQKSVFENYVQVKETALGTGGTGLGLGIVQSLVRLMGGDIGIVDKEIGAKGTCFRFNIFLTTCDTVPSDHGKEEDIEAQGHATGTPRFILILIEATAGPFPELCRAVAEFRKDLQNTCCRAVWLDKPTLRSVNFRDVPEEMISPNDLVGKAGPEPSLSSLPTTNRTTPRKSRSRVRLVKEPEIQEVGTSSNQNPLRGKRVLIAEDSMVLCKLATAHVTRLGGTVEACDNGAKAVELVCNGLRNNTKNNASIILPYDYILMDCEMPEMDGYEATKRIREEEQQYGVHIPIIALTAHANGEEAKRTIEAGMDYHLSKPLKRETLMGAIEYTNSR
ncbi:unnamed protein product, partial [Vitis vinifera]